MKWWDWAAILLTGVGSLNWGLVGLFNYNLVESLLGSLPLAVKVVYTAVGIAGVYSLYFAVKKLI